MRVRQLLHPPSGPLLTGEGLCHVEFLGVPEDARNWFVNSADIKNAFYQMRIPGWLQAFFFALLAVHASEVGLLPILYKKPVPTTLLLGFSWATLHCQDVTNHCTLAGNTDYPLFVCHDHSTLPLPGSQPGMGSLGFRWSYAENFGVQARGAAQAFGWNLCLFRSD